jgi:hypothetical protein
LKVEGGESKMDVEKEEEQEREKEKELGADDVTLGTDTLDGEFVEEILQDFGEKISENQFRTSPSSLSPLPLFPNEFA